MPLERSCSLEAYRANIATEIDAGSSRDQAVAIAHSVLRAACAAEDKPIPDTKALGEIARDFRRGKGERSHGYLEEALAEARKVMSPRAFAVVHHAARARAGGRARHSVEKALRGGPGALTPAELKDAVRSLEVEWAAAMRRGHPFAGAALLHALLDEPRPLPTKKADRTADPGVMVALSPPPGVAAALAIAGGEAPEAIHLTLAYLGRSSEVGGVDGAKRAADVLRSCVLGWPVLTGVISGLGRFAATESSDGLDVIYATVDCLGLTDLRRALACALECEGLDPSSIHDFTPHMTLAYVKPEAPTPAIGDGVRLRDLFFDAVELWIGSSVERFELGQAIPVYNAKPAAEVVAVADGVARIEDADGNQANVDCDLDVEPGDLVELDAKPYGEAMVAGYATTMSTSAELYKGLELARDRVVHETPIPFAGPAGAPLVFVSGAASPLELARGEALVGEDGAWFAREYLAPLGLAKSEVAVGHACPVVPRVAPHEIGAAETARWESWLEAQLARFPGAVVVALGKAAADTLGARAAAWLPHPVAGRLNADRYADAIGRKIRSIAKALDAARATGHAPPDGAVRLAILAVRKGDQKAAGPARFCRVAKAADEKQLVYGVVLDPNEVDAQDEWVPPAEVQRTAHEYFARWNVIGIEHIRESKGSIMVESSLVEYPTPEDERLAMQNLPHRVLERKFGTDVVKSGTWIAGVRLNDEDWAAYKRGEITGFSIGGFSVKATVTRDAMPKTEVVSA